MGLEIPTKVMDMACTAAAAAAAVSAEAMLLTIFDSEQLTRPAQQQRLEQVISKLDAQQPMYGIDVKAMVLPTLIAMATRTLLGS